MTIKLTHSSDPKAKVTVNADQVELYKSSGWVEPTTAAKDDDK